MYISKTFFDIDVATSWNLVEYLTKRFYSITARRIQAMFLSLKFEQASVAYLKLTTGSVDASGPTESSQNLKKTMKINANILYWFRFYLLIHNCFQRLHSSASFRGDQSKV